MSVGHKLSALHSTVFDGDGSKGGPYGWTYIPKVTTIYQLRLKYQISDMSLFALGLLVTVLVSKLVHQID